MSHTDIVLLIAEFNLLLRASKESHYTDDADGPFQTACLLDNVAGRAN